MNMSIKLPRPLSGGRGDRAEQQTKPERVKLPGKKKSKKKWIVLGIAAVLAVAEEHREIIARRAAGGWRYVGLIPTEVSANGCPRKADLVFEREA